MNLEAINVLLVVVGPIVVIGGLGKFVHWLVHHEDEERAAAVARTGQVLVRAAESGQKDRATR